MALNINGTTGISGVDGSASAPALQGTDSNTGINFASDTVNINTGGVTRATINSSGKLIVGSTDDYAENVQAAFYGASNGGIALASGTSGLSRLMFADATSGNAGASVGSIIYAHSDNSLRFNVNGGTERMRIDSSGKVGIGTTSPSYKLEVSAETAISGDVRFLTGSRHKFIGGGSGNNLELGTYSSNNTARNIGLVIDSSGNVGIGTSSPSYLLNVVKGGTNMSRFQQTTNNQGSDHACIALRHAAATSSAQGVGMVFQNTGGTDVGSIRFGSSTSYNTSSDYRLKENVTAISDGITRLKTLKPYKFNWISDDTNTLVDGFFAHEVTAVPEAITGTKDEVDSDNNPVYQGIDQSKLVPLLTAALQEAVAKIEVLETKVAALEAG